MVISSGRKYFNTRAALLAFIFFMIRPAYGQFHPVGSASSVQFTIHNFGFKVTGSLAPPEGDIRFHPDSLSTSFFHVTLKAQTINTDNSTRDNHLREEEYFDVKNYPLIRFVADNIRAGNKTGEYLATGTLTIKKTSREIQLPFTAVKNGNGWLLSGGFKMNRRDFEIGGSSTLSNELEVGIKVLANR